MKVHSVDLFQSITYERDDFAPTLQITTDFVAVEDSKERVEYKIVVSLFAARHVLQVFDKVHICPRRPIQRCFQPTKQSKACQTKGGVSFKWSASLLGKPATV